jgi:hypothetical protein
MDSILDHLDHLSARLLNSTTSESDPRIEELVQIHVPYAEDSQKIRVSTSTIVLSHASRAQEKSGIISGNTKHVIILEDVSETKQELFGEPESTQIMWNKILSANQSSLESFVLQGLKFHVALTHVEN